MQYDWESAYRILAAMEKYPGPNVPSPDVALDEDTGLPPPPRPRVSQDLLETKLRDINLPALDRVRERPQSRHQPIQNHGSARWIGVCSYRIRCG